MVDRIRIKFRLRSRFVGVKMVIVVGHIRDKLRLRGGLKGG